MTHNYEFQYAYGQPTLKAEFKTDPADFIVVEDLGFDFSGEGEHSCVLIEKIGMNTNDVAKILSRHFHIAPRDISYAGLKDRQAITRQWFSLRGGIKRELDFTTLKHPAIKVLEHSRNSRKIKRGSHTGNSFKIRLKNVIGDLANFDEKALLIKEQGVPNYFGDQRFGKNLDNVDRALMMFNDKNSVKERFLRSIYLSAARSWLFNDYLSQRIELKNWNTYLDGDVMSLAGTASCFAPEEWDSELEQRLLALDIHPSGPLWGAGELRSSAKTKALETKLLENHSELCQGLSLFGLKQERRALRLCPQNLTIYHEGQGELVVEFGLGKGAYATSILRELVDTSVNRKTI